MLKKRKPCSSCGQPSVIWKSDGKAKYCRDCWFKISGAASKRVPRSVKPLPRRSSKQQKLEVAYSIIRKKFLDDNPMCMAHLTGCDQKASEIHHKAGRGEYMLDTTTYLAVCRNCHVIIENNPTLAKELGFSVERLKITKNDGID